MHQPMTGVKVVEVAQFTFTPSAGAVLADWGADVIKVEHAEMGDAQRGFGAGLGGVAEGRFHPIMEHPNRGKKSIGLSLDKPGGRQVLLDLCKDADVFLTNFLPAARRKLRIEVDDIRAANPQIIYVRGSAHGPKGPDAEKGGYDGSTFWCRMGSAWGVTPADSPKVISPPAGAYGDSMGGMTIAGGIAAALFGRERTGEPSVVDVSLMSVGAWAMGLSLSNTLLTGVEQAQPPLSAPLGNPYNPIVGNFRTSDDRWITLMMLQPGRYWADACRHLGLDELIDDERFDTAEKLIANAEEAGRYVADAIAEQSFAYWLKQLQTLEGQWSPVQGPHDIIKDEQLLANGGILPVVDADGVERHLVANPVQFDETPPVLTRAPQFAEQTDDLLRELGLDEEAIIALKIDGAVT
ncbi:MAG: CoA transferase [Actinomycetota bacterium]|nr:CoA transferase [Actinomycetota bacterium]